MNTLGLLTLISVVGVAALFIALAIYLILIIEELKPTGGTPTSFLAKIRLGVRAIEMETSHIVPEITKLNSGLAAIRDGLKAIDTNLAGVIAAVQRQEGK